MSKFAKDEWSCIKNDNIYKSRAPLVMGKSLTIFSVMVSHSSLKILGGFHTSLLGCFFPQLIFNFVYRR